MIRIQFYPDEQLSKALNTDATKHSVAVSVLVKDILRNHYGLVANTTLSETDLTSKVFKEVKTYIGSLNPGDEFDLNTASKTFANIQMVYAGKPSTIKAKIGKSFSRTLRVSPDFSKVSAKLKSNGLVKKSENNATVYEVL